MYRHRAMKKNALIILVYSVVVIAVVFSVKLIQTHVIHKATPTALLADCGDPPPTPVAGE
jgi:hypothetical protein